MGRKQFSAPEPDYSTLQTCLVKTRDEAKRLLTQRISVGESLLDRSVQRQDELDTLRADAKVWSDFNTELLSRIFDTPRYSKEYSEFVSTTTRIGASPSERAEYV